MSRLLVRQGAVKLWGVCGQFQLETGCGHLPDPRDWQPAAADAAGLQEGARHADGPVRQAVPGARALFGGRGGERTGDED